MTLNLSESLMNVGHRQMTATELEQVIQNAILANKQTGKKQGGLDAAATDFYLLSPGKFRVLPDFLKCKHRHT